MIPARGGSKGLPGKNVRLFAGLPLIAHSVLAAGMIPGVDTILVSSDSAGILDAAANSGMKGPGELVLRRRPGRLAQDDTPIWTVLDHLLREEENATGPYDLVVLLEPTSPIRKPSDIEAAILALAANYEVDGVHGVSEHEFNPLWNCLIENERGWAENWIGASNNYYQRQQVRASYRMDGSFHVWRTSFLRAGHESYQHGRHLMQRNTAGYSVSIDTLDQFQQAEVMVLTRLVSLPWLGDIDHEYAQYPRTPNPSDRS